MTDPVPAASRPLATLERSGGTAAGDPLPVVLPVVTVGRSRGCDLVVDDDSVSDRHARLEYADGVWSVTDLGSTNGTALDDRRLEPGVAVPLPHGGTLRLGGVRLRFAEAAAADPEAARAAYREPAAARSLREERPGARFPVWLAFLLLVLAVVIALLVYALLAPSAVSGQAPAASPALALLRPSLASP
jgi:hypothetical protein